jgi:hypothetical protein
LMSAEELLQYSRETLTSADSLLYDNGIKLTL